MTRAWIGIGMVLAACGGGEGSWQGVAPPDATLTVRPYGQSARAADLSCGPPSVETLAVDVTLSGQLIDYISGDPLPGARLDLWWGDDTRRPSDISLTAGDTGDYEVTVLTGSPNLYATRTAGEGLLDVYGFVEVLAPDEPSVERQRAALSPGGADALAELVGIDRDPARGVARVVAVDCDGWPMANALVLLSSASSLDGGGAPSEVGGARGFYGSEDERPAPVYAGVRSQTAANGVAFFFGVPEGEVFAQVWGFEDEADVAAGVDGLALISETELPVVAGAVSFAFGWPAGYARATESRRGGTTCEHCPARTHY